MKFKLAAVAAMLATCAACGSSNNNAKTAGAPVSPTPRLTPIATIAQGSPAAGRTPRATAAPSGSASAGIPPLPAGTGPVQTTASGLQYQDIAPGSGATAASGQSVTVNYTGWLDNGTKFDSSLDRNQPFTFDLGKGSVIKGWDEGVAGMKVGGKRRLIIPGELAYGPQGRPPTIPANARLTFDIELLGVK